MKSFYREAGSYTPEIRFDSDKNILEIKGKSYPENTSLFYEPVFSWVNAYLKELGDQAVEVNIELFLINSSSAKVLMDFCDVLDGAAKKGKNITLNWIYEKDDEDNREMAGEFMENLSAIRFNMIEKAI